MKNFASVADSLPSPRTLRQWCLSEAMLEVLESPLSEWGRSVTFERRPNGWYVYVNRNGAGDEVSITFTPEGTVIRCFSHESSISPYVHQPLRLEKGLLDGLPRSLRPVVEDPAWDAGFGEGHVGRPAATFYFWRERGDDAWCYGSAVIPEDANEGSEYALYPRSAKKLHEEGNGVPLWALEHVFEGKELTEDLVETFCPGRALGEVLVEARMMGYTTLPQYWERTRYRD